MDQRTLPTPDPSPTAPAAAASSLPVPSRFPMLASLSYRDFRWMLAGSFASFLGMSMQMITRGWLVLRLEDDSPLALAMVMISFSLPMTFVSLVGGALADRLARKHLIIISQAGNAVMTVFLGVLDMNGTVEFWHIFVFGLVNGSLMAFNMPSRQAMLSEIVPEKNLMNAISLNSAVMNLTGIAGPAAAGFLILFVDTSGVFFIVGAIYVLSVILTLALNAGNSPASTSRNGIAGDIKEGLSYAAADPGRLGLVMLMLITTLFGFSYWALMPAWAREALDVQSDGLGILMAIMGIGSLVGTLALASVPTVRRRGILLTGAAIAWGAALAAFSQVGSYIMAIPFLVVIGAISATSMTMTMTMTQVLSEPRMRGRMMSIPMMAFGAMPLSALPFGALAERIGTPDALLISGVLLVVITTLFAIVYPPFRRVD